MQEAWLIFSNIVLPLLAGMTFFALAQYAARIAPMRLLVTGETTYKGAAWGFAFFGAYLASRPLQILLDPYPMPLVINEVREFCMMALFAPAVFVAMMVLCFGEDRLPRRFITGTFGVCVLLGLIFVVLNARAIGGTEVLFMIGSYPAYDGLWFKNPDGDGQALMTILFAIRMINPIAILMLAGIIVFRHARHYPAYKRQVYTNMPKKLYLLSAAVFAFPLSMLIAGILVGVFNIPNQWWIYYLGALISGLLEAASLRLPLRQDVQVSEHAQ
jgi:two-component system, response regulator YesN